MQSRTSLPLLFLVVTASALALPPTNSYATSASELLSGGAVSSSPAQPSSAAFYWVDYDGDGLDDAFAVTLGQGVLLRNAGDGSFDNVTDGIGLSMDKGVRHAAWGDFDGDGWTDLIIAGLDGSGTLWRSNEGRSFQNWNTNSGLTGLIGLQAATWIDYDEDGRLDLHCVLAGGHAIYHGTDSGMFVPVDIDCLVAEQGNAMLAPISGELENAGGVVADSADTASGSTSTSSSSGANSALDAGNRSTSGGTQDLGSGPGTIDSHCIHLIEDQATGNCLAASSVPTNGMLYPLGHEFDIDAATGNVQVGGPLGSTSFAHKLSVNGDIASLHGSKIGFDDRNGGIHSYLTFDQNTSSAIFSAGAAESNLSLETAGPSGLPTSQFLITSWTPADPNVRVTIPNANVGIGTDNPTAKLDVAGVTRTEEIQITDGAAWGYILTSDGFGTASWQPPTPGPMGPAGPTGPQGEQGLTGTQGPSGPTGPTGSDGVDGAAGSAGDDGVDGAQGPVGPTGEQGTQGLTGSTGTQGEAGADGHDGAQGLVGPTGAQGAAGSDGTDGVQGPVGPTGTQGTAGSDGADGVQGPVGPTGTQGTAGNDGTDGA
ncbi:MAG: hypothetical protein ACI835_003962, partial [Planctomycetota bacterium]